MLRIVGRIVWATAAILLSTSALAQGGQGGFGGGGIGGGVGNPQGAGDRISGRSILTPGQYGEWPVAIREGETIIVHVTSTAFDPAVELVDSNNKVIAQNDDVRVGEQDSQLLYRFGKAGKYRILVKAFKGAGGGQYELTLRRFIATDAKLGSRMSDTLEQTGARWYRFAADREQTVIVAASAAAFRPSVAIFSPIGEERSAAGADNQRVRRATYQIETKGDHYVRIGGPVGGRSGFAVTIAMAREFQTAVGQANPPRQLPAGGMDVWTLSGKAGDLLRVRASGEGAGVTATADFVEAATKPQEAPTGERPVTALVTLEGDEKSPGDLAVLLNRTGSFRVSVSQPLNLPVTYSLTTSAAGKAWKEFETTGGALRLGDSDYWFIEGKAGRIVQLEAMSDAFDTTIEMLGPHGDTIGANDDGAGGRGSLLTQLLAENGRYLIRVHAHGDGGSGLYRLRWLPNPVRALVLGTPSASTLGSGGTGIWSFTGRKDQTVIISARSTDFDTFVQLHGPDGVEIISADDGGEGTDSLTAVRLPVDGTYTLWVTAKSGAGNYSVRVIDADK